MDRLHPVVNKENLPSSLHFELDGLGNRALVIGREEGLDRLSVFRGVSMMLKSLIPMSVMWSVLGIGVAVRASTSTRALNL